MLKTLLLAGTFCGLFAATALAQPNGGCGETDRCLVQLGERLFFDTRLSLSGRTACATCHMPEYAWAEPRRVSVFDTGKAGPRNAPSILDTRYFPRLMHDGKFESLEEQVSGPMKPGGEMGQSPDAAARRLADIPSYREQFWQVFGGEPAGDRIAEALAAFERTLISHNSRFDRWLRGQDALGRQERWGFELFKGKARCAQCHSVYAPGVDRVPLFTDFGFHNTGVAFKRGDFADPGRVAVTGSECCEGAFRTPPLRNVAVTAPYMHDGSMGTLEEVIEFYDRGGRPNPYLSPAMRPLYLADEEKAALAVFLESLTDANYERNLRRPGYDARP